MSGYKVMIDCFTCGTSFQFGAHTYDGKVIPRYQISVCSACYSGNWDGWNPRLDEKLIAHLTSQGLPIPERNEKGWLPRD